MVKPISDVVKTIIAVLVSGVLGSVTTTQVLSVEIANVKNSIVSVKDSVEKLDQTFNDRVDKIEDRLLETQLKQAQYLAAN